MTALGVAGVVVARFLTQRTAVELLHDGGREADLLEQRALVCVVRDDVGFEFLGSHGGDARGGVE